MSESKCLSITIPPLLNARRAELESLLESDTDPSRAFDRLMDFVKDFAISRRSEVIILRRRLAEHQADERKLGASDDSKRRGYGLIANALHLIETVTKEAQAEESSVAASKEATTVQASEEVPPLRVLPAPDVEKQEAKTESGSFQQAKEHYKQSRKVPAVNSDAIYFCSGVCRTYRRGTKFALRGISLELHLGEITGLVGPNASGKTTMLRVIAGELRPDQGHYVYPRLHPEASHARQLDWGLIRSQISHVRQHPHKWFGRLVSNLYRHAALSGLYGEDNETEVDFVLERLGLAEYRNARWNEISGGYRMRFELAKALIARPKLLILDEPLAPLDVDAQLLFLRDLRDIATSARQPVAVIISSQHLYETEDIADKLLFIKDGLPEFYGARERIGADRRENTFELGSSSTAEQIGLALGKLITACEPGAQQTFMLRAPTSVTARDILAALIEKRIEISYFRDLCRSTRTLFGTDEHKKG
jgi:ABC-2 type transport system ATP-binding protein